MGVIMLDNPPRESKLRWGWKVYERLAEMIGAPHRVITRFSRINQRSTVTRDIGQADYAFWDKARRGKAKGLEISGLFLKPLENKVATWVLGRAPEVKFENEKAAEEFTDWLTRNHSYLLAAYREAVGLGDCYLVVNADLTVTVIPPDVVTPIVDERDYSKIIGWQIREVYPHPSESSKQMVITDRYTATQRTRTIFLNGAQVESQVFPNLIGRIPVIHIANNKGTNETFGRPEAQALITMLHEYGQVLAAALEGNKRQGRPTPVISALGDKANVNAFWARYGKTQTRTLPDGTTETTEYLEWDADQLMTLGGDATFDWKSPAPFTSDTTAILQILFYLTVQHSELPEWVFGNAIQSSKASAETQVDPFTKFIEAKQGAVNRWFLQVIEVVMAYISLFEVSATVARDDQPTIEWPALTEKDGRLTLDTLIWAQEKNLLPDAQALGLAPIDVDNPDEAVEQAREEAKEKQEEFEARQDQNIRQAEANATRQDGGGQQPQPLPSGQRPAA